MAMASSRYVCLVAGAPRWPRTLAGEYRGNAEIKNALGDPGHDPRETVASDVLRTGSPRTRYRCSRRSGGRLGVLRVAPVPSPSVLAAG